VTAPARFRQSDVTRVLRGAKAAGYERVQVRIDDAGNIVIDVANDRDGLPPVRANPLDRLLARP